MKIHRLLAIVFISVALVGCATTDPARTQARAKTAQLRQGMSQSQVVKLFGQPNEVDQDDGHHHGYGYGYGYYGHGWHGHRDRDELTWKYKAIDLEVKFVRGKGGGWVVNEWDAN